MKLPFKNSKHRDNFFDERASLLKCVSDPNCLKILDVLAKEDNPCVSDITKKLDISISAVSHQLGKLKAMGIVNTKRTGQTICYSLANNENSDLIKKLLEKS
jgi:ArsR family transcriptional regulator